MDEEKTLTTSEVADILNIQIKTVNEYCKEGKLEAFKRGNRNYITQASLDEYMKRTRRSLVSFRPNNIKNHKT
ncbi:helix-turn-helix domain-containing protein [Pelosinus propionicus]|uniref:DNA binding domain-containing protein, excisionase family n=1 Tax=Pelosinus propionicus DSM 13327 TaxID=1123291 RepID=A0A1I4QFP1_9FIRM|nr:helix-turn-helix domain-containing protein [Pelosinus propionicus]SFM38555.1 DNA binding domain-containing protein, excisionase family [Pelosinus propionicus DSM 13327]